MEPNTLYMGIGLIDIVTQKADEIKDSGYKSEIINEIKLMEGNVKKGDVERVLSDIKTLKDICEKYELIPRMRGDYSEEISMLENEKMIELLNTMYISLESAIDKFEE